MRVYSTTAVLTFSIVRMICANFKFNIYFRIIRSKIISMNGPINYQNNNGFHLKFTSNYRNNR